MNATEALSALNTALAQAGTTKHHYILRGSSMDAARARRVKFDTETGGRIGADVAAAAAALLEKEPVTYDPSYQTNSAQVMVEKLAEVPELAAVDAALRGQSLTWDSGGESPVAMAHGVGSRASGVLAYRLTGMTLATRRRTVPLVLHDGVFVRDERELLLYEPRFEAFTAGGFVFFQSVTLLQKKLQARTKAERAAKRTLAAVTGSGKRVRIAGYAELEAAVMQDDAMLAKMMHVARLLATDTEYAKFLDTERLVQFVQEHPEYAVDVEGTGAAAALKFDPAPRNRHKIPKLLADDFLRSELTGRSYDAGSKQRVVTDDQA